MTLWLIEPRDPILLRDGRPFGLTPGARAQSLEFPFPSTVAGAVRTQAGMADGNPFSGNSAAPLLQIALRGPLLVESKPTADVMHDGEIAWYAPAPADAVLLVGKQGTKLRRLIPLHTPVDAATDLHEWAPVGMAQPDKAKPLSDAPRFWRRDAYRNWLTSPQDQETVQPKQYGGEGPSREQRVHVTIRPDSQTAEDGRLFQTSGLEFVSAGSDWGAAIPLGLAVAVENTTDGAAVSARFAPGFGTLGGERRLVRWRTLPGDLPECPPEVVRAVVRDRACRILLLTPAVFTNGERPTALLGLRPKVQARLVGGVVPRPQTVSGWDYAAKQPKPSRRLVPAGSVYFLTLDGVEAEIEAFVQRVWMQCVSDGIQGKDIGQDNRDGFGLAAVGRWPEGREWQTWKEGQR